MFILAPVDQITTVVNVRVPQGGNRFKQADFEVTFKKLTVKESEAMWESLRAEQITEEATFKANILDIKGVKDLDSKDIPFSDELLEQLLDIEYVRTPLREAFTQVTMGKQFVEAMRRKN